MEEKTKREIKQLRGDGLGYKRIAGQLNISVDTVKSFCKRNQLTGTMVISEQSKTTAIQEPNTCRACHQVIKQQSKMKPRQFCSSECRDSWWRKHRSTNLHRGRAVTCQSCGTEFKVGKHSERKFCSHECYINHRFGGEHHDS
jgi:IS30 family transposase